MSLKQKTISGLIWSFVSQGGKQISQFVILVILARLLPPSDFGLIGMVTVFTGFASIFSELGMSAAIIQKQEIDDIHYSSAFWLNVGLGLSLTVLFMLLAPLIAAFYKNPGIKEIITVLSLDFFLSSFAIMQQAMLTKAMNFKALMIRDVGAVIVAGIVGIYCALVGWGAWSLVAQMLTFTLTNNLLLWWCSRWRPRWVFSLSALKDIFHFSANITGFQLVNYLARNIDYLFIGKFLGSQSLGYYTLAYKLMMIPIQNLTWVINKVMFPAFSKIQHQPEKMQRNFLRLVKLVALVSFPGMMLLFVLAPELIGLIYGSRWISVVPLLQIFCFCGMAQSISSLGGIIYLSKGRADVQFKLSLLSTSLLSIALWFAIPYGIYGITVSYTVFYLLWTNVSLAVVSRIIGLKWNRVYLGMLVPLMTALGIFFGVRTLSQFLVLPALPQVIVLILSGATLWFLLLFIFREIQFFNGFKLRLKEI